MRPPNFVGPKRVSTQKGAKSVPYGSVLGGDILKSCAHTKFESERLKIAPFRTDRTFLDL